MSGVINNLGGDMGVADEDAQTWAIWCTINYRADTVFAKLTIA
jgi:hypothetical protein